MRFFSALPVLLTVWLVLCACGSAPAPVPELTAQREVFPPKHDPRFCTPECKRCMFDRCVLSEVDG